jgi:diguanylate cyclase (GGDEF)-like protein
MLLTVLAVLALLQVVVAVAVGRAELIVLAVIAMVLAGGLALFSMTRLPTIVELLAPEQESGEFDSVTGVRNLAYLEERLRQFEQHARETLRPSIVIYIDLVNLEQVNRDFGYTTGDIVLKTIAQLIVRSARNCDIVGRVVGDEFAVVLPDSTIRDAETVSQKVRGQIKEFHMDLGRRGTIDYLSCKIGTAVFPTDGPSPEAVIGAARANMS